METPVRHYWVIGPSARAGRAFIAGGGLLAISASLGLLDFSNVVGTALTQMGSLAGSLYYIAVLIGLVAIYLRWGRMLDRLGKLGLLLAVGGFAALLALTVVSILRGELSNLITGQQAPVTTGPVIPVIGSSSTGLLSLANQIIGYLPSLAISIGMVLFGIYILRGGTNLLPGWAKRLPLVIGLFGLLVTVFIRSVMPALYSAAELQGATPDLWRIVVPYLLTLLRSVLWGLLGFAFLAYPGQSTDAKKTLIQTG